MTNPEAPSPIDAVLAEVDEIAQRIYVLENDLEQLRDHLVTKIKPLLLAGVGGTPERVLFCSPVTGKVGDVWGGAWFDATGYAKRYESRPGVYSYHTGADLNLPGYADAGKPVYATADGRVVFCGGIGGWQGSVIVIEHLLEDGSKVWTRYAHVVVSKSAWIGAAVLLGDEIGYIADYTPVNKPEGDHTHYDVARIDLGAVPGDWPGDDKARVIRDYYNPAEFHGQRSK